MRPPRISYLTATYNNEPFLRENLESVLNQELKGPDGNNFRVSQFVINDGSTDATRGLLDEMIAKDIEQSEDFADRRLFVKHLPENTGQANAYKQAENLMIHTYRSSPGHTPNYVSLLDGDDKLPLNSAQLCMEACYEIVRVRKQRAPAMIFGRSRIIDEHGNDLPDVPHIPNYNQIPNTTSNLEFCTKMLETNHIPGVAVISYPFFFNLPRPAEGYRCIDWALAMYALTRIAHSEKYSYHMVESGPLHTFRVHDGQASERDSIDGTWELDRQKILDDPHRNPFHAAHKEPVDWWPLQRALTKELPVRIEDGAFVVTEDS